MSDTSPLNNAVYQKANFIQVGQGRPIVLIHGLAASLHDWDELIPELASAGYAASALDLLGHGDSGKPDSRAYQMAWLFEHLTRWIDSLELTQPPVLIGHSLGGYLALEYARRFASRTRGLVLVDPFYRADQLPALLRGSGRGRELNMFMVERAPEWLFRVIIDATSLSMGHSAGGAHQLPVHVRAQTALDYKRTAPGTYHIPGMLGDLTPHLADIVQPTLVVWGERDSTLAPASFPQLIARLPNARGKSLRSGHVPHQSHAAEFNQLVMEFLAGLPE
ncbi:MAG TPA: alpha/beta hydrolase [Anaerolineales bacterium]|jgi:pimeloyl-ACP methyl ester carboxylesterase